MERVTLEQLARSPVGRYFAGETFVHFCATPTLWGVMVWGRPESADAVLLGRSLVLELREPAVPHVSLVDASRLAGTDTGAFHLLERYLAHYAEPLSRQVSKLALIRPEGLGGATVAGVFEVVTRPYPVQVFDGALEALAWLADGVHLGAEPLALARDMQSMFSEASETPALVGRLRALLDSQLRDVALSRAAKELGVSERTLQRRLAEAGTSFSDELGEARVRAAQTLLRESDAPLTNIALEIGCASLQHFNALFRSRVGQTPGMWRKRMR